MLSGVGGVESGRDTVATAAGNGEGGRLRTTKLRPDETARHSECTNVWRGEQAVDQNFQPRSERSAVSSASRWSGSVARASSCS